MKTLVVVLSCLISSIVFAVDLGRYVGFTIAGKKTIAGFQDEDGKHDTSFEGCNYGRRILFDDETYLTCTSYGYSYAYRPEAILLVRAGTWVMLVGDNSYQMRN
jgi:hypothetical protein